MRNMAICFVFYLLFFSCSPDRTVQISGRMENGDSIVSIWAEDSIYNFPVDENRFFSGKVKMTRSGYATLLHNSLNLYLSPGEDLEIYMDALNFSGSLYFRGSLGGMNNYLKEQEVAVFFDKRDYELGEKEFVGKMKRLISEKMQLLEAKNFDPAFTRLERERICYSIADRMLYYPFYRQMTLQEEYVPGPDLTDFLSSFSLNNDELFGSKDYRSFLLNYVWFQRVDWNDNRRMSSFDGVLNYVLATVTNPAIKDFLLMEIVYRSIWENNGLDGADYLLSVFRRECSDRKKVAYMEEIIGQWERIVPGKPAPDFELADRQGRKIVLKDFSGSYLYVMVWATWCMPCKSEFSYLGWLQRKYNGRNIRFLTVAIDAPEHKAKWREFMDGHPCAGVHAFADSENNFNRNYMIISVPRFIFIAPDGTIIDSNAPRPSGQILQYFEALNI